MRLSRNLCGRNLLAVGVLLCVCSSVLVSALPQWVWNPDADTGPKNTIGSGDRLIFGDKDKVKIKLDDAQARLFLPSIVNAISGGSGRPGNVQMPTTSRPSSSSGGGDSPPPPPSGDGSNNGGGGGGGGDNNGQGGGTDEADVISSEPCKTRACIGGSVASQAPAQGIYTGTSIADNFKFDSNGIRQSNFRAPLGGISGIFTNILQSFFGGGASTLPASIGGGTLGSSGGSSGSGSGSSSSCYCAERSQGCFLPAVEVGACDSGTRIKCCQNTRGSRTIFPEDNGVTSSNSVKTVTRSQIRRGLLKNIVRGSGDIIDDTLDLLLHPFLTKEDQEKVATRILSK